MIKVFFHLAIMGNDFQKIHDELITKIVANDLLIICDTFTVCVVGDIDRLTKFENPKVEYFKVGEINDYEFPTLQFIEEEINETDENIKILYINGLGVTNDSIYKQSWRKYLTYFNIIKWEECIKALDNGYDVCGVDWRTDPVPHFSGNFWWANSSYLKTLPKIQTLNKPDSPRVLTLRHNAEMYIGMNKDVKPRILHQSDVSQYSRHLFMYDSENYLNKISETNEIKAKGEKE